MKVVEKMILNEAIYDMADLLMRYGFPPKEAFQVSEKFWKKYKKKIRELL